MIHDFEVSDADSVVKVARNIKKSRHICRHSGCLQDASVNGTTIVCDWLFTMQWPCQPLEMPMSSF